MGRHSSQEVWQGAGPLRFGAEYSQYNRVIQLVEHELNPVYEFFFLMYEIFIQSFINCQPLLIC